MDNIIKVGSDFSGVGALRQALMLLKIKHKTVFACDMDKYARQTYIANYGEPEYYPENVYDRKIPKDSLDLYMTSPPCQAFSLAGKRKGENDKRGVLFYNSHEFIQKNKPRFFIFENVKGLLSDDKKSAKDDLGQTFTKWLTLLGGKSVNGNPVFFAHEDSVPYHIYWKVLNAKDYKVPQNRERVFIVGIRDDKDNVFTWPKPQFLDKRLKDVLEENVDNKYFLSDKIIKGFLAKSQEFASRFNPKTENSKTADCITARYFKMAVTDNYLQVKTNGGADTSNKVMAVCNTNPSGNGMNGNIFDASGIAPTLTTNKGEGIKIKSATKQGYEIAKEGDSINFSQPNSNTRRGRVGKKIAQTLDTSCNQGVFVSKEVRTSEAKSIRKATGTNNFRAKEIEFRESDVMNCITSGLTNDHYIFKEKIRKLTPRECMRLMGFPDSFKMPCSDTQMYKQAGNSIVTEVLAAIISKLKL